jgi:serine protease Do
MADMNEERKNGAVVAMRSLGLAIVCISAIELSDLFWSQWETPFPQQALPGRLVQESAAQTSYRPNYDILGRSPHLRSDSGMLRTFEQAVGDAWKSTVQIMSAKRQLSLGLIVDSNGWIVTKASQLVAENVECRLFDGTRVPAALMHVNHDLDLALLKINHRSLQAAVLQEDANVRVGGWLATTSCSSKMPVGIGVVSVGPRKIPSTRAVLGVSLGDADEGALVSMVVPGGGAYQAGIEEGDVIVSIDGSYLSDKEALLRKIATLRAGQRVTVGLTRRDNSLSLVAQLMDLSANLFDPTEMEVNGDVSARASGFPKVFQHDTVLDPHQCGGPIVDTHGRIVGINIARAGRVTSYALPIDVLLPTIREMLVVANSRPVAEEIRTQK